MNQVSFRWSFVFVMTILVFTALSAHPVQGATYTETFDGPLNPALWEVYTGGHGETVTVENGKLVIIIPAKPGPQGRYYAGIKSTFNHGGVFTSRVDFTLVKWPRLPGAWAGLRSDQMEIGRSFQYNSGAHEYIRTVFYGGPRYMDGACSVGSLQLSRDAGNVARGKVDRGSGWEEVDNRIVNEDGRFQVEAESGNEDEVIRIEFDNFTITGANVPAAGSSLSLSSGWNFVSFPALPLSSTSADIALVLTGVYSNVLVVWGYDNATKAWKKWTPGGTSNTLSTIEIGKGYWIYLNASGTIATTGWSAPGSTTLTLSEGWNLIGFPETESTDAATALSTISGTWNMAWGWDKGYWYLRHPSFFLFPQPIQPLSFFGRDKAYWIKAKQAGDWTPGVPPTEFSIAQSTDHEMSAGAAFDGTNYLVGIENNINCTPPDYTGCQSRITAQCISAATGATVGNRVWVDASRTGGAPQVAFDGTNYVMVWEDDKLSTDTVAADRIYGQRVSKTGELVGDAFQIGPSVENQRMHGFRNILFDGTNYFVVWDQAATKNGCTDEYGRFVTTSGQVLGDPIKLNATRCGGGGVSAGSDGTRILVTWGSEWNNTGDSGAQSLCWGTDPNRQCDVANIWGQFVTKSSDSDPGTLSGDSFLIDGELVLISPPAVAFDGTKYLAVFGQQTTRPDACPSGGCKYDLYGRFLSTAGTPGTKVTISDTVADHQFTTATWDEINQRYLVTWTDNFGTTMAGVKGTSIDPAGIPLGAEFTLFVPTSDGRVPWLGYALPPTESRASYLAVVNRGVPGADPTEIMAYTKEDVFGAFITP